MQLNARVNDEFKSLCMGLERASWREHQHILTAKHTAIQCNGAHEKKKYGSSSNNNNIDDDDDNDSDRNDCDFIVWISSMQNDTY